MPASCRAKSGRRLSMPADRVSEVILHEHSAACRPGCNRVWDETGRTIERPRCHVRAGGAEAVAARPHQSGVDGTPLFGGADAGLA